MHYVLVEQDYRICRIYKTHLLTPANLVNPVKLTSLCQRGPRYFLIIEMKRLAADDLIILMTFSRYQHEVANLRFSNRLVNRLGAIRDLAIRLPCLLNPNFSITENQFRIFRAWIIRRKNHHITQAARRFAHRCTLRTIAIPAATKHRDDLPFHNVARRAQHIQERIVTVRVINTNRKLPPVGPPLKPP